MICECKRKKKYIYTAILQIQYIIKYNEKGPFFRKLASNNVWHQLNHCCWRRWKEWGWGDQLALMKECPLILKLTDDNPPAYPTHQQESFFNVALRCTFIIRVKNWELDATIVLCKQDPLVHDSVYLHAHNQRIVNVRPSIVCNKKEQRLYQHFDLYI